MTQDELKQMFIYDPLTGEIKRNSKTNKQRVGTFCKTHDTMIVTIKGVRYPLTHLIWLYMYNEKPNYIYFKNKDRKDFRLENLTDTNKVEKVAIEKPKKEVESKVLTPHEVLALAKEQEAKKKLKRVPIFKGYKLCEMK